MVASPPFIDFVDIIPNDWRARTKPLSKLRGDQIFMIAHHAYAFTIQSIIATFKSPDRTVTANLAIGPTRRGVDDYKCALTVPIDTGRAYTTSSSYDDVALTFEMANLSLEPPYKVGLTGKQIAAQVAAWLNITYGMPLDRWHVTCHVEVYQRGWGSYPTACPGDDLHDALDWIVAEAKRIVAGGGLAGGGGTPIPKEDAVKAYHMQDATARSTGRVVEPGKHFYLNTAKGAPTSNATNIIGGVGPYSLTAHIYAEGVPGDVIDLQMLWDDTKTSGPHSGHYIERVVIGPDIRTPEQIKAAADANGGDAGPGIGLARRSVEFKRGAAPGDAVYLRARAGDENDGPVKVTVLDADAYLFVAA